MIGNAKWFKRRKYLGWGLTPACWQAWVYIGVFFVLIALALGGMTWLEVKTSIQLIVLMALLSLMVLDTTIMSFQLKKDEREIQQEAFAERHVAWIMISVLLIGLLYQIYVSIAQGHVVVDPFLIAALILGVFVKGITNWYLRDK